MSKTTIGYFKEKRYLWSKWEEHNIFMRRGYKKLKDWVEIGNSTWKVFFRFHIHSDKVVVWGMERAGGDNNYRRKNEMFFPVVSNDVEQILEDLFETVGIKLIKLDFKSREEIKDIIIVDAI